MDGTASIAFRSYIEYFRLFVHTHTYIHTHTHTYIGGAPSRDAESSSFSVRFLLLLPLPPSIHPAAASAYADRREPIVTINCHNVHSLGVVLDDGRRSRCQSAAPQVKEEAPACARVCVCVRECVCASASVCVCGCARVCLRAGVCVGSNVVVTIIVSLFIGIQLW
eukprot:GHVU01052149.1.p1 GENE.GHVU01052149.1~~GHVU01052149.1.p1  ORF type:complete len:166 (+),score=13.08 GHVU01052149.1:37-534(+)